MKKNNSTKNKLKIKPYKPKIFPKIKNTNKEREAVIRDIFL